MSLDECRVMFQFEFMGCTPVSLRSSSFFFQDLFFHISSNSSSNLIDLPNSKDSLFWFVPDQVYQYSRSIEDRVTPESLTYLPTPELFESISTQHLLQSDEVEEEEEEEGVLDRLSGLAQLRKQAEQRKHWESLYLITSAVPHSLYGNLKTPTDFNEAKEILELLHPSSEDAEMIVRGSINLIEYMKPVAAEEGQNLLDFDAEKKTEAVRHPIDISFYFVLSLTLSHLPLDPLSDLLTCPGAT